MLDFDSGRLPCGMDDSMFGLAGVGMDGGLRRTQQF